MTQNEAILEYLKTGNGITALEALELCGCMRLGARVADLRRQGHHIRSEMVRTSPGKHIARYRLEAE